MNTNFPPPLTVLLGNNQQITTSARDMNHHSQEQEAPISSTPVLDSQGMALQNNVQANGEKGEEVGSYISDEDHDESSGSTPRAKPIIDSTDNDEHGDSGNLEGDLGEGQSMPRPNNLYSTNTLNNTTNTYQNNNTNTLYNTNNTTITHTLNTTNNTFNNTPNTTTTILNSQSLINHVMNSLDVPKFIKLNRKCRAIVWRALRSMPIVDTVSLDIVEDNIEILFSIIEGEIEPDQATETYMEAANQLFYLFNPHKHVRLQNSQRSFNRPCK